MGARTVGFAAWRWGTMALAFGMVASCSKSHPTTSAQPAAPPPVGTVAAEVPPPAAGQHGDGKKGNGGVFKESTVYVDGKAKGILRYSELPSTLKPFVMPEIDDLDVARYYRITDYLKAIGVDVGAIREIHFYGSHDRIAVLSGEELRAVKDKMVFDFTQQVQGKPRARWSQLHALHHKPMVDIIMSIAIYAEKPAPLYQQGELWLNGQAVEDPIPYVGDGVPKGTRVYVDGKLDGWVRRKALPNKLIAPGSERHAKFSTDAFLAYVGADTHGVKAIDFFDGDVLLARVDGKAWAHDKGDYVFELPNRSHGQVKQLFPGDKSSRITSVQLYVRSAPPARQPDPEAFAQQAGGSDDSQNGGGNGDGSGGNNGVTPAAQGVNNDQSPAEDDQL